MSARQYGHLLDVLSLSHSMRQSSWNTCRHLAWIMSLDESYSSRQMQQQLSPSGGGIADGGGGTDDKPLHVLRHHFLSQLLSSHSSAGSFRHLSSLRSRCRSCSFFSFICSSYKRFLTMKSCSITSTFAFVSAKFKYRSTARRRLHCANAKASGVMAGPNMDNVS
ncbi:hypothetical protein H257_13118 [Aphanomyces astaci]|uniref:Uncharacterized protein n=1 Tax=Aphanomyces astaci TaxID=112090 RepID=W4FVY3_APHAT|nr:hypothetical protein H257_13118 [Aphanomyces astaci]ETV71685.1 hypothetical protein H257_13118 [Aphanomyces astaci]|eukprot:XP_009838873.1 hypothetical protein H257_13118 [Aphanomyces astaci]